MRSLTNVSALADRFRSRAIRLRNARSGKVALQTPARTRLTDTGEAVATWQLTRPGHHQYITAGDLEESMWEPVDVDTFGQCWTAECDELSQNRSEEHTSELQSLIRNSYAVFCLKQKNHNKR